MHLKLLSLGLLVGLVSNLSLALAQPYAIGIPLPLTGANRAPGTDMQRGFELAHEMLGASDMKLVYQDDACDSAKSVSAVKRLLEIDKVSFISGIYCNSALFAAAPVLNKAAISVLTVGATTGDQTGVGPKIFRLFPADQLAVRKLMPEMAKRAARLCVVTESEAYSELIERVVRREWPAQSNEFSIVTDSVISGERDFRTTLLRVMKSSCDAVLLNTAGDDGFIAAYRSVANSQ
jgi:branched-chain amino acid transport system substrate-binding protein